MTKTISALTARTQLGQIMERCSRGERFIVLRNGKPAVVLVGIADFYRNILKQPKKLKALLAKRHRRTYKTLPLLTFNKGRKRKK